MNPRTENGDDLIVSVLDANGNEIASARIAGTAKEGEKVLVPGENGNYCFEGITMIEGSQNFRLNLQGIQNLKEGVYLYSSEIRDEVSSQTLVILS